MSLEVTIAEAITQAVVKELQPLLKQQGENNILSEEAVLEMLGVSGQTLRRMREDGLVSYRPMGAKRFYFLKDVENYTKHKGRAV